MSKKNSKKFMEEILDGSVSANDCTGLLQSISVDNEELKEFRRQYFEEDDKT